MVLKNKILPEVIQFVSRNVAIIFVEIRKIYPTIEYTNLYFGVLFTNLNHYIANNELDINDFLNQFKGFPEDSIIVEDGKKISIPDHGNDSITFASYLATYALFLACKVDFNYLSETNIGNQIVKSYFLIKESVKEIILGNLSEADKDYRQNIRLILIDDDFEKALTGVTGIPIKSASNSTPIFNSNENAGNTYQSKSSAPVIVFWSLFLFFIIFGTIIVTTVGPSGAILFAFAGVFLLLAIVKTVQYNGK